MSTQETVNSFDPDCPVCQELMNETSATVAAGMTPSIGERVADAFPKTSRFRWSYVDENYTGYNTSFERVCLSEFFNVNAETMTLGEIARIKALAIGEGFNIGGGAEPLSRLARVDDDDDILIPAIDVPDESA